MGFDDRLKKAIERGQRRADAQGREAQAARLSEEELKGRHTKYRLDLSNHIEECIRRLPNHFPGFQFETIYGERGWGAACWRDDFNIRGGVRDNNYSRLEMTIRPFSTYHVLELTAKGTIGNKELFNRNHFEKLADADPEKFLELIDLWVLEYAEMYVARR